MNDTKKIKDNFCDIHVASHPLRIVTDFNSYSVNKNYALESFDIFPIIFVNNLNKITIEKLDKYKSQLADINLEYFDIKWWIQKIKSKTIVSDIDNILVTESEKQFKNSKLKYHLKLKKERRIKKLKTLFRKILRKINY